jgi:hypothetical protein
MKKAPKSGGSAIKNVPKAHFDPNIAKGASRNEFGFHLANSCHY